jgi:DNA-binding NtrC family response regulator
MDNILFIDDEKNILHSLRLIMSKEGYRLFFADCASKALEILRKNEIAVIVSDNKLPGISGLDLLRTVKQESPSSVRIMLSGACNREDTIKSITLAKVYRFMNKPFNGGDLRDVVRSAINKFHESKLMTDLNDGSANIVQAIQRFTLSNKKKTVESVTLKELQPGMVLSSALVSDDGVLLAKKGHLLSLHDLKLISSYHVSSAIKIKKLQYKFR